MSNETKHRHYGKTFVEPYRDPPPRVVEVEIARELPGAPISLPYPHASHVDRAKGFGIATGPLAAVVGAMAFDGGRVQSSQSQAARHVGRLQGSKRLVVRVRRKGRLQTSQR
jgi:hypothetical protein